MSASGDSDGPDAGLEADPPAGPRNRYEIRILPDGTVVFGDLPEGLLEVARVVAGSEPDPEPDPGPATPRDTGNAPDT